jgi:hypothetical protein
VYLEPEDATMMWIHRRMSCLMPILLVLLAMGFTPLRVSANDGQGSTLHSLARVATAGMQAEEMFTAESTPLITYPGVEGYGMILVFGSSLDNTTYEITTPPTQGSVTIEPGMMWGDFVYTPNPDAIGEDRFVVTITDDPGSGPRSLEVVQDIIIRPAVTITGLTCDGEITYTVGEGDWGEDGQLMNFRITSPLPEYPKIKGEAEAPHQGPGQYTITPDVRPDTYSDLTASGPGGTTLSIGECDPGGNPELEPLAEIEITELSCDEGVVFTIGDGYIAPFIYLTVELEGQYLDGNNESGSEILGSVGLQSPTEGKAVSFDVDFRTADYDRYIARIQDSGGGTYEEIAAFDACGADPVPVQATPTTLTYRRA